MRRCALRGVFLMCDSNPDSGEIRGGTSHSSVNPMHYRDGTPCFLLKGDNYWWER